MRDIQICANVPYLQPTCSSRFAALPVSADFLLAVRVDSNAAFSCARFGIVGESIIYYNKIGEQKLLNRASDCYFICDCFAMKDAYWSWVPTLRCSKTRDDGCVQ